MPRSFTTGVTVREKVRPPRCTVARWEPLRRDSSPRWWAGFLWKTSMLEPSRVAAEVGQVAADVVLHPTEHVFHRLIHVDDVVLVVRHHDVGSHVVQTDLDAQVLVGMRWASATSAT